MKIIYNECPLAHPHNGVCIISINMKETRKK